MRALCNEHSDRWCCPMQRPALQDVPVDWEYVANTVHVKSFPISSHLRQEMHINHALRRCGSCSSLYFAHISNLFIIVNINLRIMAAKLVRTGLKAVSGPTRYFDISTLPGVSVGTLVSDLLPKVTCFVGV